MNREVLHIGLREIGDTRVVRLTGELDAFTRNRLSAISETWIDGAAKIVVNLDGLQYIDSAGLSALVWIWVEARDRGAQMSITCNNPRILRIFEITGLLKLFVVESSAADVGSAINKEYVQTPAVREVGLKKAKKMPAQYGSTRRA